MTINSQPTNNPTAIDVPQLCSPVVMECNLVRVEVDLLGTIFHFYVEIIIFAVNSGVHNFRYLVPELYVVYHSDLTGIDFTSQQGWVVEDGSRHSIV